jgi:hypothetical protein
MLFEGERGSCDWSGHSVRFSARVAARSSKATAHAKGRAHRRNCGALRFHSRETLCREARFVLQGAVRRALEVKMTVLQYEAPGRNFGAVVAAFAVGLIVGGAAVFGYMEHRPATAPLVTTAVVPGQRVGAEPAARAPAAAAKAARYQDNGQPARTGMDPNAVPQPQPPVPPASGESAPAQQSPAQQ